MEPFWLISPLLILLIVWIVWKFAWASIFQKHMDKLQARQKKAVKNITKKGKVTKKKYIPPKKLWNEGEEGNDSRGG